MSSISALIARSNAAYFAAMNEVAHYFEIGASYSIRTDKEILIGRFVEFVYSTCGAGSRELPVTIDQMAVDLYAEGELLGEHRRNSSGQFLARFTVESSDKSYDVFWYDLLKHADITRIDIP